MEFIVTSILSCSPVWSPDAGPESPHDLQEPTQDPIDDISW